MAFELQRGSPHPLYFQLAEAIMGEIRSGRVRPGDRLPGERELAEQAGTSRMTVRQALDYLVRHDAIVVKHGLGTFVADPKLSYDALHLMSFTENLLSQGLEPSSQIVEQAVGRPLPDVATSLQLAEGEETLRLVRVRFSEDVPLVIEYIDVPSHLCPGLEDENLANASLYSLLADRYGLELEWAIQDLSPVVANDYESDLLGVLPGTSLMLLEGVTYSSTDQPVERFKAIYRGDRFEFRVLSERPNSLTGRRGGSGVSVVLN
jgi:GntR family transcriptional regulator